MSDMSKWLEDLRDAKSAIKSAEQALRDIRASRRLPLELDQLFEVLWKSLQSAATFVADINETHTSLTIQVFSGQRLSREQFHLISAQGILNYTNKTTGLSGYDDYEVFQHFCYESDEVHAYIAPDMEPLRPPVTIDGTTTRQAQFFLGRLPPEEIPWDCLKPEQRLFFERYLPDVAARFKRET